MDESGDTKMSGVVWESPPLMSRNRFDWDVIANALRSEPMEWGKVFEEDRTSVVNAIRQGAVKALRPDLGFEVRTRNNVREPVRTCTLYMRYNPDKDATRKARPARRKGGE
jgi:hypothetical protein